MFSLRLFGRTLTAELRNGIGLDFEFADSRPVWICKDGDVICVMPFSGLVFMVPLICITFGNVYEESEID
tara:strand:+ start:152 stop:361 length:210 start_codon:yes stop_codon:yes gene_type:complete